MLANFKWKQNTGGFARNPQNINRKGRRIDNHSFILLEAYQEWKIEEAVWRMLLETLREQGTKINLRTLCKMNEAIFLQYYLLTGGDLKKYIQVMRY